jgi:hypothetical protein
MLEASYSFKQTDAAIMVDIPLKGASLKSVDIVATEVHVKISFERYLLHLDLNSAIDDEATVAKIKQGVLKIKLKKKVSEEWPTLLIQGIGKEELKRRRADALDDKFQREKLLSTRVKDRKYEDERNALRKQMSIEEDERQHIDDLKADEKKKAEEDVYRTFADFQLKSEGPSTLGTATELRKQVFVLNSIGSVESSGGCSTAASIYKSAEVCTIRPIPPLQFTTLPKSSQFKPLLPIAQIPSAAIKAIRSESLPIAAKEACADAMLRDFDEAERLEEAAAAAKVDEDEYELLERPSECTSEESGELVEACTPEPRKGGVIKFNFTPRIFPTPMRESKQGEEEVGGLASRKNN